MKTIIKLIENAFNELLLNGLNPICIILITDDYKKLIEETQSMLIEQTNIAEVNTYRGVRVSEKLPHITIEKSFIAGHNESYIRNIINNEQHKIISNYQLFDLRTLNKI